MSEATKAVVLSRRYKCYMKGEEAWFSSEEAEKIVAAGFGTYREKVEEESKEESSSTSPKQRRTKYVDRQLRPETEIQ